MQNVGTRERRCALPWGQYNADGMASYKQGCGPHMFVRELLVQQIWKDSETGKYLVVVGCVLV